VQLCLDGNSTFLGGRLNGFRPGSPLAGFRGRNKDQGKPNLHQSNFPRLFFVQRVLNSPQSRALNTRCSIHRMISGPEMSVIGLLRRHSITVRADNSEVQLSEVFKAAKHSGQSIYGETSSRTSASLLAGDKVTAP
jgi:hypothetical protein